MVPAGQLRRAVDALEAAGAVVADQDWARSLRSAKGELTLAVYGSPLIDLHWHLIYLGTTRERFMVPTDDLLERRRSAHLRGVNAWMLDPTDFAIHIALHASFQGAHRLRRLLDIERTLANHAPDWDVLVRRCQAWRVDLPVGVMLNTARETLGAVVPTEVLNDLTGGPVRRLFARSLTSWVPSGRLPGGRSLRTGLSRSLRDSVLATSLQFATESWHTIGSFARQKPIEPSGGRVDLGAAAPGYEHFIAMANAADRYGHLSTQRTPLADALTNRPRRVISDERRSRLR